MLRTRRGSSVSPRIGRTLTEAVTLLVHVETVVRLAVCWSSRNTAASSTQGMARTISLSVCCLAIFRRSRVAARRFPWTALVDAFSRIVLKLGGRAPASATAARYAACWPAGTRMRLPSRTYPDRPGLGDRRFDARQLAVGQRLAAEQVRIRPGCRVLEQVAEADHDHGQQQPGRDPCAGRHRAKQLAHLSD